MSQSGLLPTGIAIEWDRLARTVDHFKTQGWTYVEVPWVVPHEIIKATCPQERWTVSSNLGDLVGSAEQSFLHLTTEGFLPPGRYVSCTPCFRNEDQVDWLRQKTFMKVELFANDDVDDEAVFSLTQEVCRFYETLIGDLSSLLTVQKMDDGSYDIELGGIEVGSYGLREHAGQRWMYGTAMAQPRFATASFEAERVVKLRNGSASAAATEFLSRNTQSKI